MKLPRIEIENFLTIGNATIGLDDRGLVLIQGENNDDSSQDSNGAGKSSIADALSWCLYGFTARGETGDAVVNRTAKKGCRVSTLIDDESGSYRISRHRKHKENANRLIFERIDVEPIVDLTLGTDKATQEAIVKMIGSSEEVFRSAVYMGQEQMPDLPSMTDKFLKQLIEEAAGVDRLQDGHTIARNRYNEVRNDLDKQNSAIETEKRLVEHIETAIVEATHKQTEWITNHRSKTTAKIEGAKSKKAEVDEFDETIKDRISSRQSKIDEMAASIAGASAEKAKERELLLTAAKSNDKMVSTESELRTAVGQLRMATESTGKVGTRIGTPCGECGKAYSEADIAPAIALAEEQQAKQKTKVALINERYKLAKETAANDAQALVDYRESMTDVSSQVAEQERLRGTIRTMQAHVDSHESNKRELQTMAAQIKSLREEPNPYHELVESNEKRLEEVKAKISAMEEKTVELENLLKVKEAVVKVFGPAGVRAHILDTVTPFLNDRTAHYLSTLTDGNVSAVWQTLTPTKAGELKEKFSIEASSLVGAATFKGLSGGEKRKVRLSCAMALQDLVASRASKPIELFIADEIDDALDSSGLERLMGILEEKSRSKGTVLVISHNSLSDWIRLSVTVVKESGKSAVVGEALSC